jgi:DNA polymerase I
MQRDMLAMMSGAATIADLGTVRDRVSAIHRQAVQELPHAAVSDLAINRRISRLTYTHRCLEGAAVDAYRTNGIGIAPGSKISYVVRDARKYHVDPAWDAGSFDVSYYRGLLEKAWNEISFAFTQGDTYPMTGGTGSPVFFCSSPKN